MNYTDEAYIKLIANAIGENEYQIDFSLVSKDRLMKLSAFHKTIALIWIGMGKVQELPDEYRDVFETGFKLEVVEYINKSNLLNKLSKQLSKDSIKHLLIKGKTIAKFYPQEELRRIGDIDLLISHNDRNKVKNCIEQMGGKHYYEKSDKNVDFYRLENVAIEVHSKIVTGKRFSKSSLYDNFTENAYVGSKVIYGYLCELDFITSFVYNVYHTAKHFYEGGCGVRMIADLWLMKKAMDTDHYEKVLDILEDMGLKRFILKTLEIGEEWFGKSHIEIGNFDEIQDYVITSGIYGKGNVGGDVSQIRKAKKGNYFTKVFKWLFPSYKQMRESSIWFKDKPAILLPVAYIKRGYTNIKERGGVVKTLEKIRRGEQQNRNLNNMLKIMELNNE